MDITTINTALVDLHTKLDAAEVFRQQTSFYMWGDGITAILSLIHI